MTEEEVQDLIGEELLLPCPQCNGLVYENKNGMRWCSNCSWSNDHDMTEFLQSLGAKP